MRYSSLLQNVSMENTMSANSLVFKFDSAMLFQRAPINAINQNPSPYIVPFNFNTINNFSHLTYNITSKVRLSDVLKNPIYKDDILGILFNITKVILGAPKYYANENNFVIDEDYIFIDPNTYIPSLVYLPLDINVNIREVFKEFAERTITKLMTNSSENNDCFSRLLDLVSRPNYTIMEVSKEIEVFRNGRDEIVRGVPKSNKYIDNSFAGDIIIDGPSANNADSYRDNEVNISSANDNSKKSRGAFIPKSFPGSSESKSEVVEKAGFFSGFDLGGIFKSLIKKTIKENPTETKDNNKETRNTPSVPSHRNPFIPSKHPAPPVHKPEQKKVLHKPKDVVEMEVITPAKRPQVNTSPISTPPMTKQQTAKPQAIDEQRSYQANFEETPATQENDHREHNIIIEELRELVHDTNEDTVVFCEAYLIKDNNGTPERIDINRPIFRIGRDSKNNELVIDDQKISRAHAEIISRNDKYYILDKGTKSDGSLNGIFVNGEKIEKSIPKEINNEDIIRITSNVYKFFIETN